MKKTCTGTIYKIGGKTYCVGEKTTKIKKGRTIKLRKSKKNRTRSKRRN